MSYQQVLKEVCRVANFLRSVGVKKGDSVAIYMPMVCEVRLACCQQPGTASQAWSVLSAAASVHGCGTHGLLPALGLADALCRTALPALSGTSVLTVQGQLLALPMNFA
jgi:hypothetical protein